MIRRGTLVLARSSFIQLQLRTIIIASQTFLINHIAYKNEFL